MDLTIYQVTVADLDDSYVEDEDRADLHDQAMGYLLQAADLFLDRAAALKKVEDEADEFYGVLYEQSQRYPITDPDEGPGAVPIALPKVRPNLIWRTEQVDRTVRFVEASIEGVGDDRWVARLYRHVLSSPDAPSNQVGG